jgi:hypothetical protein
MKQYTVTLTLFTGDVSKDDYSSVPIPMLYFDTEKEARAFCEPFGKMNARLDRRTDTGHVFMLLGTT